MHQALRPYATAGIALIGASIITVTPVAAPPPNVQMRPVQLVDAYSDLFSNTVANVENIVSGANSSDITAVFSALFTNPLGVISALTNLDPTVTTGTGVPLQLGVELTPALELGLAQLGAEGATAGAINDVVAQLQSDPSNALTILYEGAATILNAGLNGADNVSLLGGIIDIPLYNGILAPIQTAGVDINLAALLNALGLGGLSGELSGLLNALTQPLTLTNLTDLLNGLFPSGINGTDVPLSLVLDDLGVGNQNVADLLPGIVGIDPGLNLSDLVAGAGLTVGSDVNLGNLVTDLVGNTDLSSLTLGDALNGLDPSLNLGTLLDTVGNLLNGDLASITVSPFGGLITELVDIVPQQILASLAG